MIRRTAHQKIIPEWFDLDKYSSTYEFTAADWAQELHYRMRADNQGTSRSKWDWIKLIETYGLVTRISKEEDERIRSEVRSLRGSPNQEVGAGSKLKAVGHSSLNQQTKKVKHSELELRIGEEHDLSPLRQLRGGLVVPLIYNDVFINLNADEEIANVVREGMFGLVRMDDRPKFYKHKNTAFLKVNMDADEEEIVAGMRKAVRVYQQAMVVQKQPRGFTGKNVRKLHTYRVLPYLDLKRWEKNNSVEIPLHVLSRALYPDSEYGDDHVRDTVSKYAEWAMTICQLFRCCLVTGGKFGHVFGHFYLRC